MPKVQNFYFYKIANHLYYIIYTSACHAKIFHGFDSPKKHFFLMYLGLSKDILMMDAYNLTLSR